jgi:inner membrane protein
MFDEKTSGRPQVFSSSWAVPVQSDRPGDLFSVSLMALDLFNKPSFAMSSFFGHACLGIAIALSPPQQQRRDLWVALPVLVLLACSPDADYLLWWGWGFSTQPRWTHSLAYCLLLSSLAWLATSRWRSGIAQQQNPCLSFVALSTASCSHLLLDFLVGVTPLPLLWPLSTSAWASPWGVLPSAGHLSWSNVYFWRNLLLECGLLGLPLFAWVAYRRPVHFRSMNISVWRWMGLVFLGCLMVSVSLNR